MGDALKPQQAVAADDADLLAAWLRDKACINPKAIDASVKKLEAAEVIDVADLQVLRRTGTMTKVLAETTALRICDALDAMSLGASAVAAMRGAAACEHRRGYAGGGHGLCYVHSCSARVA